MRFAGLPLALGVVLMVVVGAASPAHAQYRNQAFVLPSVGWLGLGTWDLALHGGHPAHVEPPDAGWNLTDEPTFGLGYTWAIGYDLWADSEATIGFWTTVIDNQAAAIATANRTPVLTLNVSQGLRYDFLAERFRPFAGAAIQYMQLIALPAAGTTASVPGNGFLGNTPFFIGLRPEGGFEWFFIDEQSIMVKAGLLGFIVPDQNRGLGGLFLPASFARIQYMVYF